MLSNREYIDFSPMVRLFVVGCTSNKVEDSILMHGALNQCSELRQHEPQHDLCLRDQLVFWQSQNANTQFTAVGLILQTK